jgi:hypothetical protein
VVGEAVAAEEALMVSWAGAEVAGVSKQNITLPSELVSMRISPAHEMKIGFV